MTAKEKLKKDCPGLSDDVLNTLYRDQCPSHFGYLSDAGFCNTGPMSWSDCQKCWEREVPDEGQI